MGCNDCDRLRGELTFSQRTVDFAVSCLESVSETKKPVVFVKFRSKLSAVRIDCEREKQALAKHQQDGHESSRRT